MPMKPLRPCNKAGCTALTRDGYCDRHKQNRQPDNRPSAHQRGYTCRWSKARTEYLSSHPWCVECRDHGRRVLANEVDHIIPHRGDMELFWDRNNWQGLCRACHSRKTAREDGGFGNRPYPPPSKAP